MLVRELIQKLLEMPMGAEVVCTNMDDDSQVLDVHEVVLDVCGPVGGPQEIDLVFLCVRPE